MYCPSCGTQNNDLHKFCKKCGTALPSRQAQQERATPSKPTQNTSITTPKGMVTSAAVLAAKPADPKATLTFVGAVASMLGGAITVIGWFLPWSQDFFTATNGLQKTIAGLGSILLGLGVLTDSGAGLLIIAFGIGVALIYGIIPIWGGLNIKNGYEMFENRNQSKNAEPYSLDEVKHRSRRGFILLGLIFLIPLLLSSVLQAILPAIFFLGQVIGKLIQSETGPGIFVTAAGFVISYLGTRYAGTQMRQIKRDGAEVMEPGNQAELKPALLEQDALPSLSETEKEIVRGLIETRDEAEVAKRLSIPEGTLSMMLLDLYSRYNVSNKDELIMALATKRTVH